MSRKAFFITVAILFLLFLIQHVLIKQPDIISKVAAAEDFSDVEIRLLNGDLEPIGFYEGEKYVLLIFWTSASDACRLALEDYGDAAEKWLSKYKLEIISVNVGEPEDAIREAKDRWDIRLKIGLDEDKKIAKKFGIRRLPTIVLLDPDGSIKKTYDKYDPEDKSSIRRRIDENDKDVHIEIDKDGNITRITIDGEEPDSVTRDSIIKAQENEDE